MTLQEAKEILVAYRDGCDPPDARTIEALAIAQADPGTRAWLAGQHEFHAGMERAFRELKPPPELREQILSHAKTIPLPAWYRSPLLAAVAVVILLAAFSALWLARPAENSLDQFRSRMARSVLRQYNMELQTNDAVQIRRFLDNRKAPADYVLPPGLARLPVVGAGVLSWQGQPVSMVCLRDPNRGMLFLFIADEPPLRGTDGSPQYAAIGKLMTAGWQEGRIFYLLVSEGSAETLQRYLQ